MAEKAEGRLYTKEYTTLNRVAGPLIFVERLQDVAYGEIVEIYTPDGQLRLGQVLEVDGRRGIIQVFAGTQGLDLERTRVRFTGDVARVDVSIDMLGRALNGIGEPIDGGPPIIAEESLDVHGAPINPAMRAHPAEYIETGVSSIDGLNTLVRGQKLPIFSGAGLPANELAAMVAKHARVATGEPFAVVFAAMGITYREADFFRQAFEESGAMSRTVLFINLADDPTIERLLTPRAALTTAEYLAFEHAQHILVIMTDMTNYAEALREVSAAREEVPGRRGYPGYMYSDLASIYERAGRIHDREGSITQLIILSMPDDDITHPIPDLTGYITEGQLVLSRDLHRKGIDPPMDVLPCLSRLMNAGIGEGKTREDHRAVADQLYAFYAAGRDLRRLVAIIGEGALSSEDRQVLNFADRFEREFVHQAGVGRTTQETLELSWSLLSDMPVESLKRISQTFIEKYRRVKLEEEEA
jgi:V/A-type H+-transporting ATPase subunit B